MGDIIVLPGCEIEPGSSRSDSSVTTALTDHQLRRISRDLRHLDQVMERARRVDSLAAIIAEACAEADSSACLKAARRIGLFLSTGRR